MREFLLVSLVAALSACSSDETSLAQAAKDGGATGGSGTDARATGGAAGSGGSGGSTGGSSGAGGVDAGARPCVPGGTWTVVDDYLESGATSMNPDQLLVTFNGAVYATGMVQRTGSVDGIIRRSTDGTTFTNLPVADGLGGDLEIAADGTMFAIGAMNNARVVQRSRDNGQNWGEVDSVPLAANSPCNTGHLAKDSTGILVSAGSCDAEGWIVRKSEDGGSTWTDVERFFRLDPSSPARLISLAIDYADRVYVSGNSVDLGVTHWIVRRLVGWGTFTTVDDFELEAGMGGDSPSVGTTDGQIYAAGMASTSSGPHWIVRRADTSGGTWTTVDDFTYPNATRVLARGFHQANSTLISVGSVTDAGGVTRVITRRSTDDGSTWTVTDEWTYSPGKSSGDVAMGADRRGNVYGLVRGVASDDVGHWILRKLDCASP
jgi:hypothetical protein